MEKIYKISQTLFNLSYHNAFKELKETVPEIKFSLDCNGVLCIKGVEASPIFQKEFQNLQEKHVKYLLQDLKDECLVQITFGDLDL